jgi:hypothetical protein
MSVEIERDQMGVVFIDTRGVVSVEVSCAGGGQMLACGGRVGGRPDEGELGQDQHTQHNSSDTYSSSSVWARDAVPARPMRLRLAPVDPDTPGGYSVDTPPGYRSDGDDTASANEFRPISSNPPTR